jgi:hypothetical protein
MIRRALTSFALAAAACDGEAPGPAGPPYTPATADLLKALAAQCELRAGPGGGETRSCRGRQATMRIELDRARRIRELDITVLAASGVWEAWTLYENVLPGVVGQAVTDAVRKKLRGDPADDVAGGPRVATAIDGERYSVKLTWGR